MSDVNWEHYLNAEGGKCRREREGMGEWVRYEVWVFAGAELTGKKVFHL